MLSDREYQPRRAFEGTPGRMESVGLSLIGSKWGTCEAVNVGPMVCLHHTRDPVLSVGKRQTPLWDMSSGVCGAFRA